MIEVFGALLSMLPFSSAERQGKVFVTVHVLGTPGFLQMSNNRRKSKQEQLRLPREVAQAPSPEGFKT